MDRVIEKKKRPLWQWGVIGVVVTVGLWFIYAMLADASIRTYRLPQAQTTIASVQFGAFEDVTPIRGTIQPFNSVFLDAVDGGVVEQVLVEEGSFVEAGQPLLQLSNTDLRLNVARNDTSITEQLNNLSNISNSLETTKLSTERQLIDVEYRIQVLERQERRQMQLASDNLVSKEQYDSIADELEYQRKVLANTKARQDLEDRIREDRLAQIAMQVSKLEDNLELSQSSFENLLVRAPISGQLTSLPVEVGENKIRGQRLGQIDVVEQYKVVAQVDEYYVTRVAPDQAARFTLAGQQYQARVIKVYPEITGGTFAVDLVFEGVAPENLRRGQTLQLDLTLGNPVESLLLPLGGFLQDTGGNWVFVVDSNGEYATRRDIRVGRRNNRFVEITQGLESGERVITSSYSQMTQMERIQLTQ
ncbi:MAG: HlyD family efflux transporter periplasmic adaptor subunit [Gammaproteobacteria bacterium]|nr:HlyD family efflux transporter periplasmic adaptor subunit [Gammaproteobacteria bacterium]MDP2140287.1 HlyD family efflux transporter periplasmic adaptor subunit [Gammaproteobacteria bacterium]MDP2346195.1 HlyD family efflux transporter periplasmic adaptor subunit [Gammaproteobacteria bacterium]